MLIIDDTLEEMAQQLVGKLVAFGMEISGKISGRSGAFTLNALVGGLKLVATISGFRDGN